MVWESPKNGMRSKGRSPPSCSVNIAQLRRDPGTPVRSRSPSGVSANCPGGCSPEEIERGRQPEDTVKGRRVRLGELSQFRRGARPVCQQIRDTELRRAVDRARDVQPLDHPQHGRRRHPRCGRLPPSSPQSGVLPRSSCWFSCDQRTRLRDAAAVLSLTTARYCTSGPSQPRRARSLHVTDLFELVRHPVREVRKWRF
jgi:hypothetical protein